MDGSDVFRKHPHRYRGDGPSTGRLVTLFLASLLGGACVTPAACTAEPTPPVVDLAAPPLSLSEIRAGQRGYGLTVFSGTRIDTFAVRVLGRQDGVRAAGSVILVELSGPVIDTVAVAQGMSGSPVFIDGRFAGAVAFGWPGALRPIAGVTPAAEMLALAADLPAANSGARLDGTTVTPRDLVAWGPDTRALVTDLLGAPPALRRSAPDLPADWIDPDALWDRLAPAPDASGMRPDSPLAPLPFGWICEPLGALGRARATRTDVAPRALQNGAGGGATAPPDLAPGAACAVALVLGDARLGALGTVSWIEGDRVLMLGHPFLQRGPVTLPLATAEIVTVFPSRQLSFKLGSIGQVVGSVLADRRAGLVGRLGEAPAMIPVAVRVDRDGRSLDYEFTVAADPQLTPNLVFWCLYNALLAQGDDQSQQTLRFELTTEWSGIGGDDPESLVLRGQAAGPGGAASLAPEWIAPLQILLNNRHRPLKLTSVRAHIASSPVVETGVVAALAAPTGAQPGQTLALGVTLEGFRGDRRTESFRLALPSYLAPGRYRLVAASARDLFALETERAAALFRDRNLAATLDLIRTPRAASTLVVALISLQGSLVVAGRELDDLPGSYVRALKPAGETTAATTRAVFVARLERETGLVLRGHAISDLVVHPPTKPSPEESRP
jgi:hypothetical protein